jgi:hypothetical protein
LTASQSVLPRFVQLKFLAFSYLVYVSFSILTVQILKSGFAPLLLRVGPSGQKRFGSLIALLGVGGGLVLLNGLTPQIYPFDHVGQQTF